MNPLKQLRRGDHKYLVPYLTAGYPDSDTFVRLAEAAVRGGADILEIGVPFSDPVADGPVIQMTSQQAIEAGVDGLNIVAALTARVRDLVDIPLVWMGYLNPFMHYGYAQAVKLAADSGVDGVIVPDLPFEECVELGEQLTACDLAWIPLLTSTTRDNRAQAMLERAESFAYYVAVAGVTGARESYPDGWDRPLARFRAMDKTPVLVGFGVSGPELARVCVNSGDGVIVGSALLDKIGRARNADEAVAATERFVAELRQAIDGR